MPQALCIVYATLIWSTREAEVMLMFAGQLGCEAVNFALKRIIKEERPSRINRTGKGYGMPSSHAQFVVFWAVAMTLFLLVRHTPSWTAHGFGPKATTTASSNSSSSSGTTRAGQQQQQQQQDGTKTSKTSSSSSSNRRSNTTWGQEWVMVESYAHRPWSLLERAMASVLVLVLAAAVAWSRVYLGYHTVNQVLVGSLAGGLSAVAWYAATAVLRETGLLAWALASPVARGLRVRDLVVREDLAQAGWEKWEEENHTASASGATKAASSRKNQ